MRKPQKIHFDCAECAESVEIEAIPGNLVTCPECQEVYLVGLEGDTYLMKKNNPTTAEKGKK